MGYYTKTKHKECIIEMQEIYGEYAVFCFCILNVYKYNYRAGLKEGNSAESDFKKAVWYMDYANTIRTNCKRLRFNPIAWFMYNSIRRKVNEHI